MPLVLMPRPLDRGPLSIDLSGIVPQVTSELGRDAIERLPIRADERAALLGDLFAVTGDPSDGGIECRGDFSRVHRVGAGMTTGRIDVAGDAGRHAGEAMSGGGLSIAGSAGDWLAAEMTGGELLVMGSAGDNVAAALPGNTFGMRGGLVIVMGSVGVLAGARMRRGMLAIGGDCGEAAGFEMRAGTLVIAGRVGRHAGLGMRRGSVIALTDRPTVPATFRRGSLWQPAFIPLLLRRLERAGFTPARPLPSGPWQHWHGDTLTGSRGELLFPG
jgi:formylmethanofuran dehydrogenase subunit C